MTDIRDPQAIGKALRLQREAYPDMPFHEIADKVLANPHLLPRYPGDESTLLITTETYRCSLADEAIQGVAESHRRLFELVSDDDEREAYLKEATQRAASATLPTCAPDPDGEPGDRLLVQQRAQDPHRYCRKQHAHGPHRFSEDGIWYCPGVSDTGNAA